MGVYGRKDSPYWWMLIETTGEKRSTGVLKDAPDAFTRKQQRQDAEAIYRARMTDAARRTAGLPPRETIQFSKYATWYDTHHIAKHRGKDREREILARLRTHFDRYDLSEISSATVTEYETNRLAAKVKPRTVNREVALLKSMLVAAVPRYLTVSPLAGRKMLRVVKPKKRVLTADEETRLLSELPERDRALFLLCVDTLIRLSNAINLSREEDKGTHLDLVDSKTGPYTVPVSTRARAALDALPKTGKYFFPHRRTAKKPRDVRGAIRRLLERACNRCTPPVPYGRAIAGITWHTATRASGATRMLQHGVDPRTVQGIGNWASLQQMGDYLQTDDVRKRSAVELIGRNPHVIGTSETVPNSDNSTQHAPDTRRPPKFKKR
jgi:integrase